MHDRAAFQRRTRNSSLLLTLLLALAMLSYYGPALETRLLPPVISLTFEDFDCGAYGNDEDAEAYGVLHKRDYGPLGLPPGTGANLETLNFYTTDDVARRIPWAPVPADIEDRADEARRVDDGSSRSRPPGVQLVDVVLFGVCGPGYEVRPFVVFTTHTSPITGQILPGVWGPFGRPVRGNIRRQSNARF